MKPVHVVTDYHEKQLQRALLQYNRPDNAPLVREALRLAGREDLIGFGEECLVRPERAPQGDFAANKKKADANSRASKDKGLKPMQNGKKAKHDGAKTASGKAKPTQKGKNNAKKPPISAAKPKFAQIKRKNKV
jgi:hypothetical protein